MAEDRPQTQTQTQTQKQKPVQPPAPVPYTETVSDIIDRLKKVVTELPEGHHALHWLNHVVDLLERLMGRK